MANLLKKSFHAAGEATVASLDTVTNSAKLLQDKRVQVEIRRTLRDGISTMANAATASKLLSKMIIDSLRESDNHLA